MRNFLVDFFGRGNSPTSQGKVTSWCFQHVQPFIFLDPGVSFPSQVFKKGSLRDILYVMSTPLPVTVTSGIITFLLGNPYKPSFATVTGRGVDPSYVCIYTWNDFVLPFWMPYQKYTHCLRKPVFWNILPCFGKVPCFCIHLIPTWDSWWIQWYRRRITNTYPALWHNIFVFWGGSPINLNYTGYIIYLPSCYHPARRFSSSFSIWGWTTFLVWGLGKRRVWIWLLSVGFRVPHLPIWFGGVLWVVV